MSSEKFKVILQKVDGYSDPQLDTIVAETLEAIDFKPSNSTKVLVKPNLLCATNSGLACTSPEIVRSACLYLLDCGCQIEVADSPGFGHAPAVAKAIGMAQVLPNGLVVNDMGEKIKLDLKEGGKIGIAKKALEADVILNLPRMKAHRMMRFTGAVKNLYGCISGVEKAMLHTKHGNKQHGDIAVFSSLIADLEEYLPRQVALMDAIVAMSVDGPMNGKPLPLNFLASSANSIALDTAIYTMIGKEVDYFPIWRELQRRRIAASFPENIEWAGEDRENIDISKFRLPKKLMAESFTPKELIKSAFKRMYALFKV